jgi:hypothetical protein
MQDQNQVTTPDQMPDPKRHAPAPSTRRSRASRRAKARPRDRPKLRVRVRRPRYPLMNQLNPTQVEHLRAVAQTYVPDMSEPAAVEVLLVLLEVCHILDLVPSVMEQIFGATVLHGLATWGSLLPPHDRTSGAQRVWVWMPGATRPLQGRIDGDGAVRVSR